MRLGALVRRDLARSRRRLTLVGGAVAFGVAVICFFSALTLGVRTHLVEPLLPKLPLDLIRVEPKILSVGFLAFDGGNLGAGLDPGSVGRLRALEGVAAVHEILGVAFPLRAEGGAKFVGGSGIRTDLFAAGLDPALVAGDVASGFEFKDPGPDAQVVPVLLARRLVDLYNASVAPAIQRPKLSESLVIGFTFDLTLGASYIRGTPDPSKVRKVVGQVVGFSDHASLVGINVPVETLRRWNRFHTGGDGPIVGAVVRTTAPDQASSVASAIDRLGLKVDDTQKFVIVGFSAAAVLLALLAASLLGLAGLAIAQTFFLLVAERQRELAIMRAMGARRRDLRRLVLVEAAAVGALAGVVGVVLGGGLALALERVALGALPDFPLKPPALVAVTPTLALACLALGVVAAVLGAYLPALAASRADPAEALRA